MGEDVGAGWRVERTNSGEGSLEMWDSKADFQGAGGVVRWVVVVDMVWRRRWRRWWGAMVAEFAGFVGLVKGLGGQSMSVVIIAGVHEMCGAG